MERESFENEEIAKILNENFIPIKIDRWVISGWGGSGVLTPRQGGTTGY